MGRLCIIEKMKTKKIVNSYHHGDLENSLIEAAVGLIKERNAPVFSIREVAKLVDVSHAAAYRHFKSKTTLLARIAEIGFSKLSERFEPFLNSSDGETEVRDLFKAYVLFAMEETGYFRTMFHSDLEDHKKYPALLETSQKCYQMLRDCVSRIKMSRVDPPFTAEELIMAIWSSVHGLSVLLIEKQFKEPGMREDETLPTRYADCLCTILLYGLFQGLAH